MLDDDGIAVPVIKGQGISLGRNFDKSSKEGGGNWTEVQLFEFLGCCTRVYAPSSRFVFRHYESTTQPHIAPV